MSYVYTATAILLQETDDEDPSDDFFRGVRTLEIVSANDSFVNTDAPQSITVTDTTAGMEVMNDTIEFVELTFDDPGGGQTSAVYVVLDVPTGGINYDTYLLLVSGTPVPDPVLNESLAAYATRINLSVLDLDPISGNPYEEGATIAFADVAGVTLVCDPPADPIPDPSGDVAPLVVSNTVTGDNGNDRLVDVAGNTEFQGLGGADTLIDRDGSNLFYGGTGNDRVVSGDGDDQVYGDTGDDVVKTLDGDDLVFGGDGADVVLSGLGNDIVIGGDGDDVVKTSEGNDYIGGGDGVDVVFGWRGEDTITGGNGNDVLRGDFDDDTIEGGAGNDRLVGGPGRDIFVFSEGFEEDRILDWRDVSDKLDFTRHAGVCGLDDLSITQVATSVVITDSSGGRIVIAEADQSSFSASDFLF